ncbi:MAG: hypothetical protein QW412_00455, partial [Candidatus Aenigmatarchaeota archaeon]
TPSIINIPKDFNIFFSFLLMRIKEDIKTPIIVSKLVIPKRVNVLIDNFLLKTIKPETMLAIIEHSIKLFP